MTRKCTCCGSEFETDNIYRKTCSGECSHKMASQHRKEMMARYASENHYAECRICGAKFKKQIPQNVICQRCKESGRHIDKQTFFNRRFKTRKPGDGLSLSDVSILCSRLGLSYGEASARACYAGMKMDDWLIEQNGGQQNANR